MVAGERESGRLRWFFLIGYAARKPFLSRHAMATGESGDLHRRRPPHRHPHRNAGTKRKKKEKKKQSRRNWCACIYTVPLTIQPSGALPKTGKKEKKKKKTGGQESPLTRPYKSWTAWGGGLCNARSFFFLFFSCLLELYRVRKVMESAPITFSCSFFFHTPSRCA